MSDFFLALSRPPFIGRPVRDLVATASVFEMAHFEVSGNSSDFS